MLKNIIIGICELSRAVLAVKGRSFDRQSDRCLYVCSHRNPCPCPAAAAIFSRLLTSVFHCQNSYRLPLLSTARPVNAVTPVWTLNVVTFAFGPQSAAVYAHRRCRRSSRNFWFSRSSKNWTNVITLVLIIYNYDPRVMVTSPHQNI